MLAAVLESKGVIKMKDIPVPSYNDDEALVRVKSCGLCGTDIHAYYGEFMPHFPLILGHEFSGIIEKAGKNIKDFKEGDKVVVMPEIYCHHCSSCRSGLEKHCLNWESIGTTVDGAFAEYISVHKNCLFSLPENVSFDEGAFVEPATCIYTGIRTVSEYFSKRVIILGAGSIGLIYLKCLVAQKPLRLDIIDVNDEKLGLAKKFGADNIYNVSNLKGDYFDLIKNKYDVVIDCTGVPTVLGKGFSLLDKSAHFIFFGVAPPDAQIGINPYKVYENSWKITGIFPDMRSFKTVIDMISLGTLDFKPLISHKFNLSDFPKAFDLFLNSKTTRIKIIINN